MQTDAQANAKAVWPCVRCLDRGSSVATLNSVLLRVWQRADDAHGGIGSYSYSRCQGLASPLAV